MKRIEESHGKIDSHNNTYLRGMLLPVSQYAVWVRDVEFLKFRNSESRVQYRREQLFS